MNKLYKYLPFDIKVKYQSEEWNLLGCYNENYSTKIWCGTDNHRVAPSTNEVKPILRPFEDLTEELPLTKAAAEMIGMREGEVIIPAIVVCALIVLSEAFKFPDEFKIDVSFELIAVKHIVRNSQVFIENGFILSRISPYSFIISEKPFDFLRAMKFAVDFKEDEYIKLEK